MNESEFYHWLKPRLPGLVIRIENAISAGLPDVAVIYEGRTYWLELKATSSVPLLRPYQLTTLMRMWSQGGTRGLVVHLNQRTDAVSIYHLPWAAEIHDKHYRVTSAPVFRKLRNQITFDEICCFLKNVR